MRTRSILIAAICCISLSVTGQNLILDAQAGKYSSNGQTSESFARDLEEVRKPTEQQSPFTFVRQEEGKSRLFLELKADIMQQIITQHSEYLKLTIPVDGQHALELELVRKNILAPGFAVITGSGEVDRSTDGYLFYHGSVQGHDDNWAAVSIIEGEMTVFINDRQGSYTVSRLANSDSYAFFSETELRIPFDFVCKGEHEISTHAHHIHAHNKSRSAEATCPIPIYLEVDHLGYTAMGSSTENTRNFSLSLFSQVVALYAANPVNIPLKISAIKIWDIPDPYLVVEEADPLSKRIESFADIIKNDYPGRIAHLMTIGDRSVTGSAVNLGGVLCNRWTAAGDAPDGPTDAWAAAGWSSVLPEFADFQVYSPSVLVVTHELGHNLGSTHTFNCAWGPNGDQAIDNCDDDPDRDPNCTVQENQNDGYVGTLMGYCRDDNSSSNPRMEFHPEVLARIKNHYNVSMETCSELICEKECAVASAVEIQVGQEYIGRTSDGSSNISSYSCDDAPNATGPEVFHRIVIPESKPYICILQVPVGEETNLTAYFLESDCLASRCFHKISTNRRTTINYTAGTYYIAVDGNNGDSGIYRLRMLEECSELPPSSGAIQSGDYIQNSEINTSGSIANSATVRFTSQEGVNLEPEFEVPGQAQFTAQLGECFEETLQASTANDLWAEWSGNYLSVHRQKNTPLSELHYTLATPGNVSIELFGIDDKTISTLLDNKQTKRGSYSIELPPVLVERALIHAVMKVDGRPVAEKRWIQ